ncbi:MAG: zinc-dependent metalloprotease [Halieaceae bacterium]|jgi:hypothetical protein|nr:zinc-dependent metalloprotease [Halieaceae bacterium]
MRRLSVSLLFFLAAALHFGSSLPALAAEASYQEMVDASEEMPGFLPLYWHSDKGRLFAAVDGFEKPFIYYTGLSQGVGSNDLGLDRGRLGDTQLVQFERHGPRVLLMALNTRYVANSDNADERAAVEEAFARSVLWGFEVEAEQDGKVLIDLTAFAQRDAMHLGELLARQGEGNYKVDESRSAIFMPRTKVFPDNTEVDALITLAGQPKGDILETVVPDPHAITVHKHHSFVRLPEPGYEPLVYDPRAGFIDAGNADTFLDYATPFDTPVARQYARRHRLEKVDPTAARSPAIEPIVYYVDRGVPEPIRSALIEGASWWNQAFEAAGYEDAFQVRLLPEGADPMDVRYNVIQWVHRSTRGWSYGMSIRDPRTQEIIKGHVSLGSLRVRQDYLLAEGLLAPYDGMSDNKALREFALARIRQLSAHEVGHTIGLEHNFAASSDGRASVMDYPHPKVLLDDNGELDISDAYDVGIGEWDKRAIIWGYQDFPDGVDEVAAREDIIEATLASGLHFIADRHSRVSARPGAGPAHPRASLWDNGEDPVAELQRLMTVRNAVLNRFSERVVREGDSLARLEDLLVPVYLMHRYQVQAAATVLGGREFSYALRGDGQTPTQTVSKERQMAALEAMLETLSPDALTLSPSLVALIPPKPPGAAASRELFPRSTGYLFDPLAAAASAAQLTLGQLLDARRASRLNNQQMLDGSLPGFRQVLDRVIGALWSEEPKGADGAVARRVQIAAIATLVELMGDANAAPQVRAEALAGLDGIRDRADKGRRSRDAAWQDHHRFVMRLIDERTADAAGFGLSPVKVPPGSPI